MKELGSRRDRHQQAFREAEANFRLSGVDPLLNDHYKLAKERVCSGEISFGDAIRLAVDHHIEINTTNEPQPVASADDDPYCYPGTDVPINRLGIRDKEALEIAETEIGVLREAQLRSEEN